MSVHPDATVVPPETGGPAPFLQTKLNVPRSGSGLVVRERLTERLTSGLAGKLTIVSAPAGFGKTTLLAQWLAVASSGRGVAWVSLDPTENDPPLFWTYVIQALARVGAGIGAESLALLRSAHAAPIETVLTVLLNEVGAAARDVVLVLDDYHVIEAQQIHDALGFLVERQPERMHVVLASRSDPPLPVARLRARGELTELPPSALRFSPDEMSAYLNDVLSLSLTEAELGALEQRTEGWITAIKLSALTGARSSGQAAAFRGGNGYVADYVIEEVLRAEPEEVRAFLLATSVLERLTGSLCDEVADRKESRRLLASLAARNLFVVALDDDGVWYRYHHLFAEVLRAHAKRVDPELLRTSHHRASVWHEHHGSRSESVAHALAGGDVVRAADLLETEWPEKNRSNESARWLRQARLLPDPVFAQRPVLAMAYAWALLNAGEPDAAHLPLQHVESWLSEVSSADGARRGMVVVDRARYPTLPAELAAARGYLAQMQGDAPGTIEHARRALSLIPEDDSGARATGTSLVALALWGSGRLAEAHDTFTDALGYMRRAGRDLDAVRGIFVLGDIRVAQGRLREAAAIYEGGLRQAEGMPAPEIDELFLGLSELHSEWGDPDTAERYLERLRDAGGQAVHSVNRQRWCVALARIREARGDAEGALACLVEGEAFQVRSPLPQPRPLAAIKARNLVSQGRLTAALAWAEGVRLSADDELTYARDFEHLTFVRVLLASHRADMRHGALADATTLLERLAEHAERDGRNGSLIEALALLGLARHAGGNLRGALEALGRALSLAEPEGYFRLFAGEGTPMRDLLRQALARGVAPAYAQRLLSGFAAPAEATLPGPSAPPARLTSREEVVLRLLASGLRNQEIAQHLFISPATVKRHIANIYLKLDVGHRTAALARAAELNLL